jgi:adenosylcobyric acid synthase
VSASRSDQTGLARTLAVFGTGSDVGKSVIATGLCRLLRRRGLRVAPFKAQNMSNNSGVTPEGLEMGRAQIVQAEAAGIPPHVDMNPVLLKPTSELGCQVVVLGRAVGNDTAVEYHRRKEGLFAAAAAALDRLRREHDAVVLEGAGSCAEVNLMDRDIVNFPMAVHAAAPVVLVADIHRGGVFGQLVGTLACLPEGERARIAGFVVNRFRGDVGLFADGVRWIEARTGKPVFGVVPWFDEFAIEQEDSVVIESPPRVTPDPGAAPAVAVIRIPHISNFTDFDPLRDLAGLTLHFLETEQPLEGFRAVILPGSKNTRFDLEWLGRRGWVGRLAAYAASGGHLLGICGGYQMLGAAVHDPHGLEGAPGTTPGLGLLPVETTLEAPKTTTRSRFRWEGAEGLGYEIHMGRTVRRGGEFFARVTERNGVAACDEDGCVEPSGRVLGTYLHGLFDAPAVTRRWLAGIGLADLPVTDLHGPAARDRAYDALADHLARHLDVEALAGLMGFGGEAG